MSKRGRKCAKPSCSRMEQNGGLCRPHYALATRDLPTGKVDPAPVADHIKNLAEAGISNARLGQLCDIPQNNIWAIASGRRKFVFARTAAKILSIPLPAAVWSEAKDGCPVPVIGTQRRLRALMAIGYPSRDLAERLSMQQCVVVGVSSGRRAYVTARVARDVAALFDKLQMTQGPSAQSRRRAAAKGWRPPLAWDEDEIDKPTKPRRKFLSDEEFASQYEKWQARGYNNVKIAQLMGMSLRSVQRRRARNALVA